MSVSASQKPSSFRPAPPRGCGNDSCCKQRPLLYLLWKMSNPRGRFKTSLFLRKWALPVQQNEMEINVRATKQGGLISAQSTSWSPTSSKHSIQTSAPSKWRGTCAQLAAGIAHVSSPLQKSQKGCTCLTSVRPSLPSDGLMCAAGKNTLISVGRDFFFQLRDFYFFWGRESILS